MSFRVFIAILMRNQMMIRALRIIMLQEFFPLGRPSYECFYENQANDSCWALSQKNRPDRPTVI